MEDIAIPMLVGNMEDIAQEQNPNNESSSGQDSLSTNQQYEREARQVSVLASL